MEERDSHSDQGLELIVVDDDELTRNLLERVVRRLSVEALVTEDSSVALEMVEANLGTLRLLVTDVMMPGIDGVQLAKLVRQLDADLPILMISGYPNDEFQTILGKPNIHFMQKPFLPRQFLEFVERFVGAQRASKRRQANS